MQSCMHLATFYLPLLKNVSPSQPVPVSLLLTTQLPEIRGKIRVAREDKEKLWPGVK